MSSHRRLNSTADLLKELDPVLRRRIWECPPKPLIRSKVAPFSFPGGIGLRPSPLHEMDTSPASRDFLCYPLAKV